jgi:hypothetical protein
LEDVVEFTVSAKDSFETFLGRRYDPSEASWGLLGSALLSQEAVVPSHAAYERLAAHLAQRMGPRGEAPPRGAGGGPPPAALLSPLDRFAKLLAGLQGLQAELREVEGGGGGGGGGVLRVLSDSAGVAAERLEALRPAAAAAAAGGARAAASRGAGGGPVAAPAPLGAQALRALLADVAALQEAQAAAAEAQARVAALTAALSRRVKALAQSAQAAGVV